MTDFSDESNLQLIHRVLNNENDAAIELAYRIGCIDSVKNAKQQDQTVEPQSAESQIVKRLLREWKPWDNIDDLQLYHEPPCKYCKHWKPIRKEIGVSFCHSHQHTDFSCFDKIPVKP